MAISSFRRASATGGTPVGFLINTQSGNDVYSLEETYPAGVYDIKLNPNDNDYDIYSVSKDGTESSHTASNELIADEEFDQIVILGVPTGTRVAFSYQGEIVAPTQATDEIPTVAGAVAGGVVQTSLPNIDDTTVINGRGFSSNVEVYFIDQNDNESAAKNVVRNSSRELVVTRPDSFSPDVSPYTIRVENGGRATPSGTNSHILINAVTAGTNPVWSTDGDLVYNIGAVTPDITLLATDTEGSDIDYSIVSGSLPSGLSLDGETGVISGTFDGSAVEGDSNSVTFRAIDAGGNFLDKSFNFVANSLPTWTTPSGELSASIVPDVAYSLQLDASTGTRGGAITYSLVSGTLPNGITLSSSGLLSGTSTEPFGVSFTITVRATDEKGLFAEREFIIPAPEVEWTTSSLPELLIGFPTSVFLEATIPVDTIDSYSVVSGSLPDGLILDDATGEISGSPTSAVTESVTFRATSVLGSTADQTLSITTRAANEVILTSSQTYTTPAGYDKVHAFIVGGGGSGAGGNWKGRGGGGGGSGQWLAVYDMPAGTYTASIGGGGARSNSKGSEGSNGSGTSFAGYSVSGGSRGTTNAQGGSGGSGGGRGSNGWYNSASGGFNGNNGGGGNLGGTGLSDPFPAFITPANASAMGNNTSNFLGGSSSGGGGGGSAIGRGGTGDGIHGADAGNGGVGAGGGGGHRDPWSNSNNTDDTYGASGGRGEVRIYY